MHSSLPWVTTVLTYLLVPSRKVKSLKLGLMWIWNLWVWVIGSGSIELCMWWWNHCLCHHYFLQQHCWMYHNTIIRHETVTQMWCRHMRLQHMVQEWGVQGHQEWAAWLSGCVVIVSAFPASSPPGVKVDAMSSSMPSWDLADLSGESSTFGGTTSVLIGTGGRAVVNTCPISVKSGGRPIWWETRIITTPSKFQMCLEKAQHGEFWAIDIPTVSFVNRAFGHTNMSFSVQSSGNRGRSLLSVGRTWGIV